MKKNILLMTKQLSLFMSLNTAFNDEGFFVVNTTDGEKCTDLLNKDVASLIWDMNSETWTETLKIIKFVRNNFTIPVMILADESNIKNEEKLFQLNIDDFIIIPIHDREIVMIIMQRIWTYNTLHRIVSKKGSNEEEINFNELPIKLTNYSLQHNDKTLGLTPKEYKLLMYLASHPNQVISREQLLQSAWGYDISGTSRIIDIHISHIRDKIEKDPGNPQIIKTIRGFGYLFSTDYRIYE